MAYTKLGRIRPVYKGTWSASAAYTALEMVKSADGRKAYIAVKDVPKGTALTNAAYWGVVLDVSDVLDAADEAIAAAVARADEAAASANAAAALAPKPLELVETTQPAQIWPEAGSSLRPVISMLPAQTGSGDPSAENVRPISGREAAMVTRCGRNLLPTPYTFAAGTTNGVSITKNENGSVTLDGTANADTIRTLREKMPLPGGKYILSGFHDTTSFIYAVTYYANGDRDAFHYAYTGEVVCTVPPGGLITVSVKLASGAAYNNRTIYPMLRPAGDADATYEPYQGETFSLILGQTVYGGILDVASGTLTITHKLIALKDRNWRMSANETGRFIVDMSLKAQTVPVCSVLPGSGSFKNPPNGTPLWTLANNSGVQIIVRTDLTTLDEWKAWLATNDPQACYELETPETVQLDPAVIPALEGLNTVTSAGESMTLTYNKSLVREHGEIMARLAALEAAALGNT